MSAGIYRQRQSSGRLEKECRGMPAAAVDTAETVNECCSHAREETVRAKGKALQDWMQEHTNRICVLPFPGVWTAACF